MWLSHEISWLYPPGHIALFAREVAGTAEKRVIRVSCYSGHTYAQRPVSFVLDEREYLVQDIKETWREPGRVFFAVITEEGLKFTLEYDEPKDIWRLADGG